MKYEHGDSLVDSSGRIFATLGYSHPPQRTRVQFTYNPDTTCTPMSYHKVMFDPFLAKTTLPATHYYVDPTSQDRILALPDREVVKVYRACAMLIQRLNVLPSDVINFLHVLWDVTGISMDSMGLFGSWQLGLENDLSDVDIMIYGQTNLMKFLAQSDVLLQTFSLWKPTSEVANLRAQSYSKELGLPVDSLLEVYKRRRSTKFMLDQTVVSLNFSWESEEAPNIVIRRPIGPITTKAIINDASASFYMPRIYRVAMMDRPYIVMSYRYFFKDIAKSGDKVHISGTLREDKVITVEKRGEFILPSES